MTTIEVECEYIFHILMARKMLQIDIAIYNMEKVMGKILDYNRALKLLCQLLLFYSDPFT